MINIYGRGMFKSEWFCRSLAVIFPAYVSSDQWEGHNNRTESSRSSGASKSRGPMRTHHVTRDDSSQAYIRWPSNTWFPDHQELQGRAKISSGYGRKAKTSSGGQQPNSCHVTALVDLRQHRRTKTMTNWQRHDPDYKTINTDITET